MANVTAAEPMKEATATKERRDSRGSPQTPCPEVHPAPIAVPKPTKSPVPADDHGEAGRGGPNTSGVHEERREATPRAPERKARRQVRSKGIVLLAVALWMIPDTPRIFPCVSSNAEADPPIIKPPINDCQGVKAGENMRGTKRMIDSHPWPTLVPLQHPLQHLPCLFPWR
jgi:hypothetical protein